MNVNQMVSYLDRAEIAAARKRRYLKTVRKLPPNLRRFAVTLKREMVDFRERTGMTMRDWRKRHRQAKA